MNEDQGVCASVPNLTQRNVCLLLPKPHEVSAAVVLIRDVACGLGTVFFRNAWSL